MHDRRPCAWISWKVMKKYQLKNCQIHIQKPRSVNRREWSGSDLVLGPWFNPSPWSTGLQWASVGIVDPRQPLQLPPCSWDPSCSLDTVSCQFCPGRPGPLRKPSVCHFSACFRFLFLPFLKHVLYASQPYSRQSTFQIPTSFALFSCVLCHRWLFPSTIVSVYFPSILLCHLCWAPSSELRRIWGGPFSSILNTPLLASAVCRYRPGNNALAISKKHNHGEVSKLLERSMAAGPGPTHDMGECSGYDSLHHKLSSLSVGLYLSKCNREVRFWTVDGGGKCAIKGSCTRAMEVCCKKPNTVVKSTPNCFWVLVRESAIWCRGRGLYRLAPR